MEPAVRRIRLVQPLIPAGRPVAVHCEGGYRSAIAASLLQKLGRHDVHDIVGGYKAWLAAKLPA